MSDAITDGAIRSVAIDGKIVRFFIVNKSDLIQVHHLNGVFYEAEELKIIADHFPRGGVYVDIGANIGNHVLYVGHFLHPRQMIVFEPNPPAAHILRMNVSLNDLSSAVDFSFVKYGVSDRDHHALPHSPDNNLGATRFHVAADGVGIPLTRGDRFLRDRRVDFLKIDVEGMEMFALRGLEETIAAWRPAMFIEIENGNADAFLAWAGQHHYVVAARYRRYEVNENFMIVPIERQ